MRDYLGRKVFSKSFKAVQGNFTTQVSTEKLSSGIYLVSIEMGDGSLQQTILVK